MKNMRWVNKNYPTDYHAAIYSMGMAIEEWSNQFPNPPLAAVLRMMPNQNSQFAWFWEEISPEFVIDRLEKLTKTPKYNSGQIVSLEITKSQLGSDIVAVDNIGRKVHVTLGGNLFCGKYATTICLRAKANFSQQKHYIIHVAIANDDTYRVANQIMDYVTLGNYLLLGREPRHPAMVIDFFNMCLGIYDEFGNIPTNAFLAARRKYDVKSAIKETDQNLNVVDEVFSAFIIKAIKNSMASIRMSGSLGRIVRWDSP